MNKTILIGRVGKDPEVKRGDNWQLASFSLATDESYKDRNGNKVEATEWHNIVVNGKLADTAEKYIKKGQKLAIEGKIRTRSWDDKDGNKRYSTEIIASTFEFCESVKSDSAQQPSYAPPVDINSAPQDDDLPF